MAGTWRVVLDTLEILEARSLLESAKNALYALNRRESSGYDTEDGGAIQSVIVEVGEISDPTSMQRTRAFTVPEDGKVRLSKVMFVPAPAEGSCVQVRVLKNKRGDPNSLVGEGRIHDAAGQMDLELVKRNKPRAVMRLVVSCGLPQTLRVPTASVAPAIAGSPQSLPSHDRSRFGAASPASAASAGASRAAAATPASASGGRYAVGGMPLAAAPLDAAVSLDGPSAAASPASVRQPNGSQGPASLNLLGVPDVQAAASRASICSLGPRPLRQRPPNLPYIGTFDVLITNIKGLEHLRRPYFIVGLEGQEFRAEDVDRRGEEGLRYSFSLASVLSNLQVHVFEDTVGPHVALGRILLPATDVLWNLMEKPSIQSVRDMMDSTRSFTRGYEGVRLLPPSPDGEGSADFSFFEAFGPEDVHAAGSALGTVDVEVEVVLREAVRPLLGLYATSMVSRMQDVAQLSVSDASQGRNEPTLSSSDPEHARAHRALLRARGGARMRSYGIGRWLRRAPANGFIAAGAWMLFCWLGFFPCSFRAMPVYFWLGLLANGVAAALQRRSDWKGQGEAVANFAGSLALAGSGSGGQDLDEEAAHRVVLAELAGFLGSMAAASERIRNLLSFADVVASTAFFALAGIFAGLLFLSFFLLSFLDPTYCHMSALYGAVGLLGYAKTDGSKSGSVAQWVRTAINELFECVPDDVQMMHRYVAARVQCEEAGRRRSASFWTV